MFKAWLIGLALLMLSGSGAYAAGGQAPGFAADHAGYAAPDSCAGCHVDEAKAWRHSDHAWSMRRATPANVLGDFNDAQFVDGKVEARFFRKGDSFYVHTEGADGKAADFEIRYTFGYRPLQQYLVAFPAGRLQSLTIAWDSRPKEKGGQRWFSLYPGQHFMPSDPLHWTGRYQNWNAMCADCHSTDLEKHYDDSSDTFATTWQEQNVGCQSCHGPAQAHVDWARKRLKDGTTASHYASPQDIGLQVDFARLGSHGLIGQCARCHSRRQPLGAGPQPGKPLLDAMLPSVLSPGLYHADGQIQGEVYVFGSFAQSKMYAAGVACTDCHNPHTTRVKIQGNGLCLQCHNTHPPTQRFPQLEAKNYDSPAHHHHPPGSPGAQCVNCHMPTRTFMGVDARRDHGIRIPRPDLDAKTDSPDACTGCHKGKTPSWAVKAIDGWFAHPQRRAHYGLTFAEARAGKAEAFAPLARLIADGGKPAIVRATAVDEIAAFGPRALPTLEQALHDRDPLVRAYAASSFDAAPAGQRLRDLLPLLDDPRLAVRDEALRALADIPASQLPADRRAAVDAALKDYERRLRSNADLPGNRLNLAVLFEREGRRDEAQTQYRMALKLDPYFSPARVNLVSLLNRMQQPAAAVQLLRDGVALAGMPQADHGQLAYMLALSLVQQGQRDEALHWLDEAAKSLPLNARIRYNQGLLLLQMQHRPEARAALEAGLALAPRDPDLLYALMYLHASAGERQQALKYIERLEQVSPGDPRVQAARRQLMAQP